MSIKQLNYYINMYAKKLYFEVMKYFNMHAKQLYFEVFGYAKKLYFKYLDTLK